MDVQLPDGTLVQGVPDGMSKADLAAKLKSNGMAVPDDWMKPAAPAAEEAPQRGGWDDFKEAVGAGIKKIGGMNLREAAAESEAQRVTRGNDAAPMIQLPGGMSAGPVMRPMSADDAAKADAHGQQLQREGSAYQPQTAGGYLGSAVTPLVAGAINPVLGAAVIGGSEGAAKYTKSMDETGGDVGTSLTRGVISGALNGGSMLVNPGSVAFGQGMGTLAKTAVKTTATAAAIGGGQQLADMASDAAVLSAAGYDDLAGKAGPHMDLDTLGEVAQAGVANALFHVGGAAFHAGMGKLGGNPIVGEAPRPDLTPQPGQSAADQLKAAAGELLPEQPKPTKEQVADKINQAPDVDTAIDQAVKGTLGDDKPWVDPRDETNAQAMARVNVERAAAAEAYNRSLPENNEQAAARIEAERAQAAKDYAAGQGETNEQAQARVTADRARAAEAYAKQAAPVEPLADAQARVERDRAAAEASANNRPWTDQLNSPEYEAAQQARLVQARDRVDRAKDLTEQSLPAQGPNRTNVWQYGREGPGTGMTQFDRDSAAAQLQTMHEQNRGFGDGTQRSFADLTPMTPREAQNRLLILRSEARLKNEDPSALVLTKHPDMPGRLAIARLQEPETAPPTPRVKRPAPFADQRLAEAAKQGVGADRELQKRQAADQILRNIEQRGGVASPEEAAFLKDNGHGAPYDRVDPSLGAQRSMDDKLTGATGIDTTGTRRRLDERYVAPEPTTEAPHHNGPDVPVVTNRRHGDVPWPDGFVPPEMKKGPATELPPEAPPQAPPEKPQDKPQAPPAEGPKGRDTPMTRDEFMRALQTNDAAPGLHVAVERRSMRRALEELGKSNNPIVRRLAEMSSSLLGRVSFKGWPTLSEQQNMRLRDKNGGTRPFDEKKTAGFYSGHDDTIAIRPNLKRAGGKNLNSFQGHEMVVAHEIAHGLLQRVMDNPTAEQRPAVQKVKALYAHAKRELSAKGQAEHYGLTNIHEFMSEALANRAFQYELSQIKYGKTSAWSKFVQFLSELTGIKDHNALYEALGLAEELGATARSNQKTVRGEVMAHETRSPEDHALGELSKNDTLFRLKRSESTDMKQIAADSASHLKVGDPTSYSDGSRSWPVQLPNGKTVRITERTPTAAAEFDVKHGPVYEYKHDEASQSYSADQVRPGTNPEDVPWNKKDVWVDVAGLKPGEEGSAIYHLAANFAHNNGAVFIGDPNGFTAHASRARLENMIASSLKFGTTDHLAPHPAQVRGANGMPALSWTYGDHVGNVKRMIDASLARNDRLPDSARLGFDTKTGAYTGEDGHPLTDAAIEERAKTARALGAGVGETTLKRAAVLRALRDSVSGDAGAARDGADGRGLRQAGAVAGPGAEGARGQPAQGELFRDSVAPGQDGPVAGEHGQPVGLLGKLLQVSGEHGSAVHEVFAREVDASPEQEQAKATLDRVLPEDPQAIHPVLRSAVESGVGAWARIKEFGGILQDAFTPMARGDEYTRAKAKDYANSMRKAQWQWDQFDRILKDNYHPEQLERMWNAGDEESVARQQGRQAGPDEGLNRLTADERATMDVLQKYGGELLQRAKEAGMFKGEGLPYWTPRVAARIDADGNYMKPSPADSGAGLKTTTPNLKYRKHLFASDTQEGMRAKLGDDAVLVRDIRVMPLAMARMERAIAGRELVNSIKQYGESLGLELVHSDADRAKGFADVPGLRGMYVAKQFEGPLHAVLSGPPNKLMQALMAIKGHTTSMIMFSPMIHNVVEFGRALPVLPMKVLTGQVYFEGNRARKNPQIMREAIDAGFVPINADSSIRDITGLNRESDTPGRSLVAKGLGKVGDLVGAGDAVRSGVDKAGDFWHKTLLWDRIADLQMGLYVNLKPKFEAKLQGKAGISPDQAARGSQLLAAHMANRYAGALPKEAMSRGATQWANMLMFSRTFTLGNLGAMKDTITGLPRDVKGQLMQTGGEALLRAGTSVARRKAIAAFVADVGLMYVTNSVMQTMIQSYRNDPDATLSHPLDAFAKGLGAVGPEFLRHADELGQKFKEDPGSVLWHPWDSLASLTSTGHNEPGKEDRIHIGSQDDGTGLYLRSPLGKVGEDMKGWASNFGQTAYNKTSQFVKPVVEIAAQSIGSPVNGKVIWSPDDNMAQKIGKSVAHIAAAQLPMDEIGGTYDWMRGAADDTGKAKVVAPLLGLTVSKGYPGGPEAGMQAKVNRDFAERKLAILPQVNKLLRTGDQDDRDQAIDLMRGIRMTPGEIGSRVKAITYPAGRVNAGTTKRFNQRATDDDKARMQDLMTQE